MKFIKPLLIFLFILCLSAFLTPWIFELTSFRFERILSRLVMILSLGAIFFARIRLRDLEKYGLIFEKRSVRFLSEGFVIGFLTLALLTSLEILLGGRQINANWEPAWTVLLKTTEYFFASLLIGVTEEFFFRGFVYTQLKSKWSTAGSLVAANLIYAALHFFKGGRHPIPQHPTFMDSFKAMLHLADPLLHPLHLGPHLLGLFIFGCVLSYCFLKTRSLFLSIGIHAGSVFLLKIDNWFIASVPNTFTLLFGDKNLHSGILGWCFLGLLFLFLRRRYSQSPTL